MIQTLRISDALRCILLNAPRGPNLACPREGPPGVRYPRNTHLWKESLAQSRTRVTVVWWDGLTLGGLASARIRSGPRVWEVDRFYLAGLAGQDSGPRSQPDGWTDSWVNLLERLAQAAGERGAERVFLRLAGDHPGIPVVRRAGFFPYFKETLLEGAGVEPFQGSQTSDSTGPDVRLPEDDFALFQLYSAATPLPVREALGLTFDQWQDAQDPHSRRRRQWTVSHNGRITGWLGLYSHHQEAEGEVLVHPAHPETLPALLALALTQPGRHRWLVPDYQPQVAAELERRGFQPTAEYTMLVTTVAAPVLQPGMAPMEA